MVSNTGYVVVAPLVGLAAAPTTVPAGSSVAASGVVRPAKSRVRVTAYLVRADGSLIPRGEPGALITDPAAAADRARAIVAAGGIETLCCHADTPSSLAIVRAVRAALGTRG